MLLQNGEGIFCRDYCAEDGRKAVGKLFRLVPEKKGHHKMANHVETDSPSPLLRGKRRGLFLITDIYFRTVFMLHRYPPGCERFSRLRLPEQEFLIRSPFTTGNDRTCVTHTLPFGAVTPAM